MSTVNNLVNIAVYDLEQHLTSGVTGIAIFTSASAAGTYTEITTSATRITILQDTEYYTYLHSASGISNNTYKHKWVNASGVISGYITSYYYGNSSDLTELLRYAIEDIDNDDNRYTIKELRRFVKIALFKLQSTTATGWRLDG